MIKWEEKYQQLNAGELDTKLVELEEKENKKLLNKDEYKEYETLKRVKENMPKIANVLEYKEKLQEQLKEINEEIAIRKEEMKSEQNKQKLEEELENILFDKKKYEKKLENKELTDEERSKLEEKLAKCKDDYKENNDKFSELLQKESKENKKDKKVNELSKMSEEELKNKKLDISTKVSKCNMICNNLLQGKSWDYIDMRLEKWEDKKFTSDKETGNKMRSSAAKTKQTARNKDNDLEKFVILPDRKNDRINDENNEQIKNESLPVEVSKFAKRHPKLAALGNKFKQFLNKLSQRGNDEVKQSEPKVENKKEPEVSKQEEKDFRSYIKEIAEKGYNGIEKEDLDAKREQLEEKRKAYKEAAYKRETEKYGEEYAKSSYNPKEKEEERS